VAAAAISQLEAQDRKPGQGSADKSLREWIDGIMQTTNAITEKPKNKALHKYGKERRAALSKIATAKAKLYD
jgi:hypothetical protein